MHLRGWKAGVTSVLAVASMVALAACSSGGSGDDGSSSETTTAGAGETTTSGGGGGTTELVLWHGYTEADGDVVQKIIDSFNASQSEWHVTAEQMAWASITEKLVTSLGAGNGPNAIVQGPDTAQGYVAQGAFISQQGYYDDDTTYTNKDHVYQNLIDQVTWDGETYGVPMGTAAYSIYYNKKLWADAGLTDADVPTTLDELIDVAKKMTVDADGDGTPETYGFALPDQDAIALATLLHSGGGDFITDGKANLYSDANKATLEKFQKAFVDDKISPTGMDATAAMELFGAGRAGMIFNGPWEITSAAGFGVDAGVFAWPGDWTAGVANYWWATNMNDTDEKLKGVYAFEDFWNSYDQQVVWTESYYPPNRDDIPLEEMAYPIIADLSEMSKNAHYYMSGSVASLPDITAETNTLMTEVVKGGDVDSLLKTAQDKIAGYLG